MNEARLLLFGAIVIYIALMLTYCWFTLTDILKELKRLR